MRLHRIDQRRDDRRPFIERVALQIRLHARAVGFRRRESRRHGSALAVAFSRFLAASLRRTAFIAVAVKLAHPRLGWRPAHEIKLLVALHRLAEVFLVLGLALDDRRRRARKIPIRKPFGNLLGEALIQQVRVRLHHLPFYVRMHVGLIGPEAAYGGISRHCL